MLAEVIIRRGDQRLAELVVQDGDHVIGRDPACEIAVEDASLSRRHARLTIQPDTLRIEDLGSANGTFVEETRVTQAVRIEPGQRVRLGSVTLEITRPPENAATASPASALAQRRYEVGSSVAEGGMGAILAAKDPNIRRTVAMKVLRDDLQKNSEYVYRFIEEAQVTGQLEHPNIVPVHELGVNERGEVFYTMKFVKGVTLAEALDGIARGHTKTIETYPLGQLLTIFQKVCDAVAFAHSQGVIHRDLKPDNIMIGDYGEVLVMDWGIAKVLPRQDRSRPPRTDASGEAAAVNSARADEGGDLQTMAGMVMGTPDFMAPEQALGQADQIGARTDIYSLGGILYNILTLQAPVRGADLPEILRNVVRGEIAHPSTYHAGGRRLPHCPNGKIPESLAAVAMKALATKKEGRYQSVKALQFDIGLYQGGYATGAEQAGAGKLLLLLLKRRQGEAALIAASLVIVTALLTGFIVSLAQRNRALESERKKAQASEQQAETEKSRAQSKQVELEQTAPTYHAQAVALLQEQKFDEALPKITYAVTLVGDNPDYLALKGNLCQSLLRLAEARDAYGAAAQLNAKFPFAEENRALCEKIVQESGQDEPSLLALCELFLAMRRQDRTAEAAAMERRIRKDKAALFGACEVALQQAGHGGKLALSDNGFLLLDLTDAEVKDISFLHALPLSSLSLARTKLTELTRLAGMPLNSLNIAATQVSDLTPLKGMPLASLNVSSTRVRDLRPLTGMPLRELDASKTAVNDITPLAGMPLQVLDLNSTSVRDLKPIKGMPLRGLYLADTYIYDLTPVASCAQLEALVIPANYRGPFDALRKMPNLKYLDTKMPPAGQTLTTAAEFWRSHGEPSKKPAPAKEK